MFTVRKPRDDKEPSHTKNVVLCGGDKAPAEIYPIAKNQIAEFLPIKGG